MGRLLVFLAALFAMGFTAHAQDDPGALPGVYGPSEAFPSPRNERPAGLSRHPVCREFMRQVR